MLKFLDGQASSQIFLRTGSDHHLYFKNAEKNTKIRSSGNFLSPEPNGQGFCKEHNFRAKSQNDTSRKNSQWVL